MSNPKIQLDKLLRLFPGFKMQWESPENYFMEDDGSFTYCGLFAEFSHYVRCHFDEMSEENRRSLFDHIEGCISGNPLDDLDNAVCTCFFENLAGEAVSAKMMLYMGSQSLEYFKRWDKVQ